MQHGGDETRYLDILDDVISHRHNRADQLLMQFQQSGHDGIANIFESCRLLPGTAPKLRIKNA
jgi:gamma-glutamylcysteine synthetase